jgi:prepilin-type N-terminal cleavage/methylation domain-containing protein
MIHRLRRRLASASGYSMIELLTVMVILTVIVSSLTALFVQASNAELDMNRRFQAQQQARVAVDRMRREIHCSSGVSPAGTSASIAVTVPGQCPTAGGVPGGPAITVTYRTVPVSSGRFRLERQVGAGPIAILADYIRVGDVFTYAVPTQTTLGKVTLDLPINIQPPGSGSNWELVADMVLRNSTRVP